MAASGPVAIGTQGTIGSLLRKEIEYFTELELAQSGSSRKPKKRPMVDMFSSTSGHNSKPSSFWSLSFSWKRKKRRRGSSGFFTSFCSAVETEDTNQLNGVPLPGFSYRVVKNELKNMHV